MRTDAAYLSEFRHGLVRVVLLDDLLIILGVLYFDVLVEAAL